MNKWLFAAAIIALFSFSCDNPANNKPCDSCITDSRDGKRYRTAKVGNLIWMAENLNYKTSGSWCYANKSGNCAKYGRLYTWADARTVCPDGWRTPNDSDWNDLLSAVGDNSTAAAKLKSESDWNYDGNGTDDFGFSALPGGGRSYKDNVFWGLGNNGFWWSATSHGTPARILGIHHGTAAVGDTLGDKKYGFSVRCVKH